MTCVNISTDIAILDIMTIHVSTEIRVYRLYIVYCMCVVCVFGTQIKKKK